MFLQKTFPDEEDREEEEEDEEAPEKPQRAVCSPFMLFFQD